ncbi:MAG: type II secretion system F family protein [Alcanivorax sp.]|nr:type II secretion system F family protein [Alcanivorax sp.]
MSAEALLNAARSLAILSVLLLAGQWWFLRLRARQQNKQRVNARLMHVREVLEEGREAKLAGGRFERLQFKAGLYISQSVMTLLVVAVLAFAMLMLVVAGVLAAIMVVAAAVVFAVLFWNLRYQKRRRIIFEHLPTMIDGVIRGIDAGRSLEQALVDGLREAPEVFEPLSFRLRSAVEAGRDYAHLMDDFAELYEVPPLVFVAVALRTSSRFGSSIRPILKQVSDALRSQEEMRREFMAASTETRMTAIAFAVLPVAIGGYVMAMNAGFRQVLLHTDAGNKMLAVALGLLALGMVAIMRLIQGVGRG